jgi:hypothetical protein
VKSSISLVIGAAALAALSLALKVRAGPTTAGASAEAVSRNEDLRRFLAANVGTVRPAQGGWRFAANGCDVLAMPSGPRGTLDLEETKRARHNDRIAFVYRGRVSERRPGVDLGLHVVAHMLVRPFRRTAEPGYVVLIAERGCPTLPALPWGKLPT